jgi:hypothetical protein
MRTWDEYIAYITQYWPQEQLGTLTSFTLADSVPSKVMYRTKKRRFNHQAHLFRLDEKLQQEHKEKSCRNS